MSKVQAVASAAKELAGGRGWGRPRSKRLERGVDNLGWPHRGLPPSWQRDRACPGQSLRAAAHHSLLRSPSPAARFPPSQLLFCPQGSCRRLLGAGHKTDVLASSGRHPPTLISMASSSPFPSSRRAGPALPSTLHQEDSKPQATSGLAMAD